ncbi:MAG: diguanylate cyclase, partial [Burkholderiales bacterium]|jgi:diguanylate cyclase (GGDEF)-like protein|nr:diguanylate cyclase [Burkholderiales bacterium]
VKVLLAEDDSASRILFSRWLAKWGYQVTAVGDGEAALEALRADQGLRLCVMDWMMPGLDGIDVCRAIRGRSEPYTYVILLTGKTNKDDVVRGLEAGADDYIVKPCNALELEVRLRAGRRVLELQEALITSREALRREAMHDALTGLLNRTALLEHMGRELGRVSEHRGSLCAIMVDVDHFKSINDEHGHLVGDSVLRMLARRFEGVLRTYDAAGRFGGEEFLLALPDCDAHYGQAVAERLRKEIESRPVRTRQGDVQVTASFGVAAATPGNQVEVEGLIRAADAAMYRAKFTGRNRVCAAEPGDWESPVVSTRSESMAALAGLASRLEGAASAEAGAGGAASRGQSDESEQAAPISVA